MERTFIVEITANHKVTVNVDEDMSKNKLESEIAFNALELHRKNVINQVVDENNVVKITELAKQKNDDPQGSINSEEMARMKLKEKLNFGPIKHETIGGRIGTLRGMFKNDEGVDVEWYPSVDKNPTTIKDKQIKQTIDELFEICLGDIKRVKKLFRNKRHERYKYSMRFAHDGFYVYEIILLPVTSISDWDFYVKVFRRA